MAKDYSKKEKLALFIRNAYRYNNRTTCEKRPLPYLNWIIHLNKLVIKETSK